MQLALRRPPRPWLDAFLDGQRRADLTYAPAGMTREPPPSGWTVDHHRVRLGSEETVFAAARTALAGWRMFPSGWTDIYPQEAPPAAGLTVAVLIRALGITFINATRVVYEIDDEVDGRRRFGFAYGTLPAHGERGEERFLVEMDPGGAVHYDILAYSRPAHWLARLGYPVARRLQRRFARDSLAAMSVAARSNR